MAAASQKMRILALYPFLPYPVLSGAAMRGCSVLDVLSSAHEVTLASFVGKDDRPSELPSWKTYPRFSQPPILVPRQQQEEITPQGQRLRTLGSGLAAFQPEMVRFFDSASMWNRIASLDMDKFDAVHVRLLGMTPYALALKRMAPHLRLVIDLDDNPSLLLYRNLRNPQAKAKPRMVLWQLRELVRLFAFELRALRRFDSVWICSAIDRRRMSRRLGPKRVLVVENVIDTERLAGIDRRQDKPSIIMVGDFNYPPNAEGASFFVLNAWPEIRSALPETELWLVGKNTNPRVLAWDGKDGIHVTGMVDDVRQYLARATVSVAPLFVGTGTKLKILEALASGIPVVTTRIGAEGIDVTNGVDILLADSAKDFADCCIRLLQDPELRRTLINAGQELIRAKYDISVMSSAVLGCYSSLEKRRDHAS